MAEALLSTLGEEALALGATAVARFDARRLVLRDEVRDMCLADRCGQCGKNWMCPPAVGSLEEWRERLSPYTDGLLVQVTAAMEDEFDYEAMVKAEKTLKAVFAELRRRRPAGASGLLYLTAGSCDICPVCTYPDAPCRFPELSCPSLEAVGIVVTDLCRLADTPYYYGPLTLTFSGAVLSKG